MTALLSRLFGSGRYILLSLIPYLLDAVRVLDDVSHKAAMWVDGA